MFKLKKMLTLVLALALSISSLAGCQSGSKNTSSTTNSDKPVVLKHWFWPDSDMHTKIMQGMVTDFNATNGKNITVELEIHPWDGGQYSQDLFTAAMGGGAPDTAGFKLTATPLFTANKLLVPLDSYINSWNGKDDIQETLYKTLRGVTKDGNLYLMPWNTQILYVYYRPSMFKEVGIDIPKTYEEFLQDCRKLTRDTNGDGKKDVYGYGLRGSKGGQEPWGSFIYARGGSFDKLTSDASIQGMQDFINLYKDGCTPPSAPNDGFNEIIANFQSGLTAMTIQHIGSSVNMMKKFGDDVAAFPFPNSPQGRWTSMGDTETVMFSTCKNKEAAFKWMSYLATGAGQKTWCVQTGNVPVSKTVQQSSEIQSNRFMKVSIEGAPFAGILPVLDTTTDWISTTWPATIQSALLGKTTAKEAMVQLDKALYSK